MSFQRLEYSGPHNYGKDNKKHWWRVVDSDFADYITSDYKSMLPVRQPYTLTYRQLFWPISKTAEVYKRRSLPNNEFFFGLLKFVADQNCMSIKDLVELYQKYDINTKQERNVWPIITEGDRFSLYSDYKEEFEKILILL